MGFREHETTGVATSAYVDTITSEFEEGDETVVIIEDLGNQERWTLHGDLKEIGRVGADVMTRAIQGVRPLANPKVNVDVHRLDAEVLDMSVGEAGLRVFEPNPDEGDLGRMFVLSVFGVDVVVRERSDGTYVHVESVGDLIRPPLLVEVNNGGEHPYGWDGRA